MKSDQASQATYVACIASSYSKSRPASEVLSWLESIPRDWRHNRLKFVSKRITDGAHISPDLTSPDKCFVSTVDLGNGGIDLDRCLKTSQQSYEYMVHTGCKPFGGDVLFSKDGTVGKTAVVPCDVDFVVASSLVIITPNLKHILPSFLDYWLNSPFMKEEYELLLSGAALRRISVAKVGQLLVCFPKLETQRRIIDVLNFETARIDTLIAKKQRLIELLQEKRTALISHAVTKGLNPNAEMKDSGVEWLGKIPKHWNIRRLKYVAPLFSSKLSGNGSTSTYLGLENIESWTGRILEAGQPYEAEGVSSMFKKGHILFGKLRPYLAKATIAPFDGIATSELLVLEPSLVSAPFLLLYMLTRSFIEVVNGSTYGAKMPRASWDFIGNMPTAFPPSDEQEEICSYISANIDKVDSIIARISKACAALAEYRSALISSAVTGQLSIT